MVLLVHCEMTEWVLLNNQRTKMFSLHLGSHLPDLSCAQGSLILVLLFQCIVVLVFEHTKSVSTSQSLSEHEPFHMTVFS